MARNAHTFQKGKPPGPGRPRRETERSYLNATMSACTPEDWIQITRKAVEDAKRGSATARRWLSDILIGRDPLALREVIDDLRDVLESVNGDQWASNGRMTT
jgi:hypothetical protein